MSYYSFAPPPPPEPLDPYGYYMAPQPHGPYPPPPPPFSPVRGGFRFGRGGPIRYRMPFEVNNRGPGVAGRGGRGAGWMNGGGPGRGAKSFNKYANPIASAANGEVHSNLDDTGNDTNTNNNPSKEQTSQNTNVMGKIEGLPKELTSKLHPNKCDLCVVVLNSTLQAKMHYEGKNHTKKMRQFLLHWCEGNDDSLNETVKVFLQAKPKAKPETSTDGIQSTDSGEPEDLYCKFCDLSFTSPQHAHQHYMGRNHQRRSQGLTPLKTGYFNRTTGRWQRLRPAPLVEGWGNGRGGANRVTPYGVEGGLIPFMASDTEVLEETILDENADLAKKAGGEFRCDLCGVHATSQSQLDMHLNGSKHKSKMQFDGRSKSNVEGQPI